MKKEEVDRLYSERYQHLLVPIADKLRDFIQKILKDEKRIDRVVARAKSVERFVGKALAEEGGKPKYSEPMTQIQDQIGARVIVFYENDVERISEKLGKYFTKVEEKLIVPDSDSEFGYTGKHFVFFLIEDVKQGKEGEPKYFELQVKTLFQHAWAEAEHDLGYKPSVELSSLQKRKIAFTAAQAWGADRVFMELVSESEGRAVA